MAYMVDITVTFKARVDLGDLSPTMVQKALEQELDDASIFEMSDEVELVSVEVVPATSKGGK